MFKASQKIPYLVSEHWGYGKDNGKFKIFGRSIFPKIKLSIYLFDFDKVTFVKTR